MPAIPVKPIDVNSLFALLFSKRSLTSVLLLMLIAIGVGIHFWADVLFVQVVKPRMDAETKLLSAHADLLVVQTQTLQEISKSQSAMAVTLQNLTATISEATNMIRHLVAKLTAVPDNQWRLFVAVPVPQKNEPDPYDCPERDDPVEEPKQNTARFDFGRHGRAPNE